MKTTSLQLRKIGNSLGLILSKEAVQLLGVAEGDSITLTESPDGIRLTPFDPHFEQKMKAADSIISRYKNTLRELAK
jgi:putative addiction module antidote